MAMLSMEDAAKKSGKDPRELRRLLRNGTLAGKKDGGSWTVDSKSLDNLGKAAAKPAAKAEKAEKAAKGKKAAKAPKVKVSKKSKAVADEWGEDAEDEEE